MKNYVSAGEKLAVTVTGSPVVSGQPLVVENLFGVCTHDAAVGEDVQLLLTGIVELPKATGQAWPVGDRVYWDSAAGNVTTTVGSNQLIGVAAQVAASGDTLGAVRLNGTF